MNEWDDFELGLTYGAGMDLSTGDVYTAPVAPLSAFVQAGQPFQTPASTILGMDPTTLGMDPTTFAIVAAAGLGLFLLSKGGK